jgi:DNA-binding NtrC family response regulator
MVAPSILLIDDEPFLLNSIERLVEDDFTVFKTTLQKEAIEIAHREKIQVVVSDQRMPGILGHKLLSEIKAISPSTIRILLTGYADLEATVGAMDYSEIFRYIQKPWKASKLLETVLLAQKVYARIEASRLIQAEGGVGVRPSLTKILIVSNSKKEAEIYNAEFESEYSVMIAQSVSGSLALLQQYEFAVLILTGLSEVSGVSELEFLTMTRRMAPETVPIFLSHGRDKDLAIKLINESSAFRYLPKSISFVDLKYIVSQAIAQYDILVAAPLRNLYRVEEAITSPEKPPVSKTLRDTLVSIRSQMDTKKNY